MLNSIIARRNRLTNRIFTDTFDGCKGLMKSLCNGNQQKLRYSDSAAYAGDGKTTVTVLNKDQLNLNLVNTYSASGFRLSNNLFIKGSILLFPLNVYCWNVRRGIEITPESLMIFDIIVPKTKIIIIGYGEPGEPYDDRIPLILKKKGISCEMLATPHAVTTYNYLANDAVHVAGAFIPVQKQIIPTADDIEGTKGRGYTTSDREYFPLEEPRDTFKYYKELFEKNEKHDRDKKGFE